MARAFSLEPSDEGPRYDGPHGPLVLPPDQAPDSTRVQTPEGEATLAWGMLSQDRAPLKDGVRLDLAGRSFRLRLAGRALMIEADHGQVVAIARPKSGRRVTLERPDGAEVAWFKSSSLSGEVEDAASADEVALLLLLLGSNAAAAFERRIPLPFSPFGLLVLP